jgi:hypothetical protein
MISTLCCFYTYTCKLYSTISSYIKGNTDTLHKKSAHPPSACNFVYQFSRHVSTNHLPLQHDTTTAVQVVRPVMEIWMAVVFSQI